STDEAPLFRKSWRLATSVVCSVHRCRLLDRCTRCGSPVGFYRQSHVFPVHFCVDCQMDLREMKARSSGEDEVSFNRLILDAMECEWRSDRDARGSLDRVLLALRQALVQWRCGKATQLQASSPFRQCSIADRAASFRRVASRIRLLFGDEPDS